MIFVECSVTGYFTWFNDKFDDQNFDDHVLPYNLIKRGLHYQ